MDGCDQRYGFPLVLAVAEVGVDSVPFVFPLVLGRTFLPLASEAGRGALWSFITIFAWISSSFEALTFFGQNNVTKLLGAQHHQMRASSNSREKNLPPKMPAPSLSVLSCCFFLVEDMLYAAANQRKRIFQDRDLVVSRHFLARQLELFLHGTSERVGKH